jgi:hypothetical protein
MIVREMLLSFMRDHPDVKITWISGRAAEGPDDMAYHFAKWDVESDVIEMKAKWDENGRGAGFIRNAEMAEIGDELILAWDGRSHGSKHMRDTMRKLSKTIHARVVNVEDQAGQFEVFDFTRIAT